MSTLLSKTAKYTFYSKATQGQDFVKLVLNSLWHISTYMEFNTIDICDIVLQSWSLAFCRKGRTLSNKSSWLNFWPTQHILSKRYL